MSVLEQHYSSLGLPSPFWTNTPSLLAPGPPGPQPTSGSRKLWESMGISEGALGRSLYIEKLPINRLCGRYVIGIGIGVGVGIAIGK